MKITFYILVILSATSCVNYGYFSEYKDEIEFSKEVIENPSIYITEKTKIPDSFNLTELIEFINKNDFEISGIKLRDYSLNVEDILYSKNNVKNSIYIF